MSTPAPSRPRYGGTPEARAGRRIMITRLAQHINRWPFSDLLHWYMQAVTHAGTGAVCTGEIAAAVQVVLARRGTPWTTWIIPREAW